MNYFNEMPNEYFSALDKESYIPDSISQSGEDVEKPLVKISDMGIPTAPFKDQIEELKRRIFQGVRKVEMGFTGAGKGNQQNPTPEMYGKPHREVIKQLAKLNKVKLSTHTTVAVGSLSGLKDQAFSDEARKRTMIEIQRTIDFASDIDAGGAVVVHTGEFQRALGKKYDNFESFENDKEKAPEMFVDKETGKIIGAIDKKTPVYIPKLKKDENGNLVLDEYGNFVVDISNKGDFELKEFDEEDYKAFKKYFKEHYNEDLKSFEHAKIIAQQLIEKNNAEAYGKQYASGLLNVKEKIRDAKELISILKSKKGDLNKLEGDEKLKALEAIKNIAAQAHIEVPKTLYNDLNAVEEYVLKEMNTRLRQGMDVASKYLTEAKKLDHTIKNIAPVEDYALDKAAQTLAESGLYVMEKSKKTSEPLYISPENVFAETYGGHPQELKKIVLEGRKRMEQLLLQKGKVKSREEAKKLAEKHIKATFDIAHANTLRKNFKGTDEEFKKWLISQVEDLAKEGIIGHLHVADNLGYEDEHLAPGEGNAPIREFVEKMKKYGVTDIIVEPSHNDINALKEGWKVLAGNAFSSATASSRDTWSSIEGSYFGRTNGSYFLFAENDPNKGSEYFPVWKTWGSVPLE